MSSSHYSNIMHNEVNPLDRPVIATADDAILAKRAAVAAGYYDDPFLEPLCAHAEGITLATFGTSSCQANFSNLPDQEASFGFQQPSRSHRVARREPPHGSVSSPSSFLPRLPPTTSRGTTRHQQPIIKRGTHARVCCIDRAISAFASIHYPEKNRQVVVLGAGKDTSYFRYQAGLMVSEVGDGTDNTLKWFEVDHPSVIQSKAKTIQSCAPLSTQVTVSSAGTDAYMLSNSASPSTCHLLGHDLRLKPQQLLEKLSHCSFDPKAVTLFVLECVEMYLPGTCLQLKTAVAESCISLHRFGYQCSQRRQVALSSWLSRRTALTLPWLCTTRSWDPIHSARSWKNICRELASLQMNRVSSVHVSYLIS